MRRLYLLRTLTQQTLNETFTRPCSCALSEFSKKGTPGLGDRIFPAKVSGAQRDVLDSCVQLLIDHGWWGKEKLHPLERERRNQDANRAEEEEERARREMAGRMPTSMLACERCMALSRVYPEGWGLPGATAGYPAGIKKYWIAHAYNQVHVKSRFRPCIAHCTPMASMGSLGSERLDQ